MGKDGVKAGGVVRRNKTSHTFTQQIFIGHPHMPQTELDTKDNRQIKAGPMIFQEAFRWQQEWER